MNLIQKAVPSGTALQAFWHQMRPLIFVILAMLFGTVMTVIAKLLETSNEDDSAMSPSQLIIFARFLVTSIVSHVYMAISKVQHAPFGPETIRWDLVGRGVAGFIGVYGLFYSVKYLPTTVATVFTFLTPIIGPWLSFFYIGDPFPLHEQLAGASSLIGVFIVAFGETGATQEPPATNFTLSGPTNSTCELHPDDASCQLAMVPNGRVLAMAIALFGVLGAAVAYTLIRKIGNRAHSLIIVNYLSDMATVLSFVILLLSKGIQLPSSISQGFCLVALGLCGFTSQFLLTMGFQEAETSAAALMIYTQLLFAMGFDWLLWRNFPGWSEWLGCCIIIGSAAFVAIKRTRTMILVAEPDKADDEVEEHLMNDFGASNSEGFHTTRRHSTTRRSHSE